MSVGNFTDDESIPLAPTLQLLWLPWHQNTLLEGLQWTFGGQFSQLDLRLPFMFFCCSPSFSLNTFSFLLLEHVTPLTCLLLGPFLLGYPSCLLLVSAFPRLLSPKLTSHPHLLPVLRALSHTQGHCCPRGLSALRQAPLCIPV